MENRHYVYFEDYIESLVSYTNQRGICCNMEIKDRTEMMHPSFQFYILDTKDTFFFFVQGIPNPLLKILEQDISKRYNVGLVNTEQLTRQLWKERFKKVASLGLLIIDYSIENIMFMKSVEKNTDMSLCYHVPPFYSKYSLQEEINTKTRDVMNIGNTSSYRQHFLVYLWSKGIDIKYIRGFGKKRDAEVFSFKILVNIHFAEDFNIHEHIRTDRCVYEKIIVITEPSLFTNDLPLRPFLIVANREEIPSLIHSILSNYEDFHDQFFQHFDSFRDTVQRNSEMQWECVLQQLSKRIQCRPIIQTLLFQKKSNDDKDDYVRFFPHVSSFDEPFSMSFLEEYMNRDDTTSEYIILIDDQKKEDNGGLYRRLSRLKRSIENQEDLGIQIESLCEDYNTSRMTKKKDMIHENYFPLLFSKTWWKQQTVSHNVIHHEYNGYFL